MSLQLIICHKKELLSSLFVRKLVLIRNKCYQWKLVCTGTMNNCCKILTIKTRGGVEDTRLEAKDTKKIRGRGQGQPFRRQTLSRPRTGMLEAKATDQGHKRKCSPKKKGLHKNFFHAISKEKKGLHKNFSSDLHKKTFSKNFSSAPQNFNNSKNSAVLEPRAGQFSRTWGLEAKAKDKDFKMCPRGLHLW